MVRVDRGGSLCTLTARTDHQKNRRNTLLDEAMMVRSREDALLGIGIGIGIGIKSDLHRCGACHCRTDRRSFGAGRHHVADVIGYDGRVEIDVGDKVGLRKRRVLREIISADEALFLRCDCKEQN